MVSIPRSGFWAFRPSSSVLRCTPRVVSIPRSGFWAFRPISLNRNARTYSCFNPSVGILGFQTYSMIDLRSLETRFNPSVGILGFQTPPFCGASWQMIPGFNPSVGILGFQTQQEPQPRKEQKQFQSLGRDSGLSDKVRSRVQTISPSHVSIPRSGFWAFRPITADLSEYVGEVSIPRSGFWAFRQSNTKGDVCT